MPEETREPGTRREPTAGEADGSATRGEVTVGEAGRRGGRRTLARKGKEHFREIGSLGGKAGGSAGGRKGGARVRALIAAGKRALRLERKGE